MYEGWGGVELWGWGGEERRGGAGVGWGVYKEGVGGGCVCVSLCVCVCVTASVSLCVCHSVFFFKFYGSRFIWLLLFFFSASCFRSFV